MDATTFARTYQRHLPPVRATCRRLLGDAALAEDVAQEAFARLWNGWERLAEASPAAIGAWLHRTSRHLAIDELRSRRRGERAHPDAGVAGGVEGVVTARSCLDALQRDVPRPELEVALRARIDGADQLEIARAMGVSERTVRRLLARFDRRTGGLRSVLALAICIAALFAGRSCAASTQAGAVSGDVRSGAP
jgi:DNA-directed RNA polymerase specialized sigma24 family protein